MIKRMLAPELLTDRLVLRPPQMSDFEHWATYYASDRSIYEDGPFDRRQAWKVWASGIALWQLKGFGPFGVDDRQTGHYLGEVGIYQPEGYPEPELGWFVVPNAEGRGIAYEAAKAVMCWLKTELGFTRLVNYIDPRNERSIALGLRLGGRRVNILGSDPTDVVIELDLTKS